MLKRSLLECLVLHVAFNGVHGADVFVCFAMTDPPHICRIVHVFASIAFKTDAWPRLIIFIEVDGLTSALTYVSPCFDEP